MITRPLTESEFDSLRDEVLDDFDFADAARIYALLGWTWENIDGVPKERHLRKMATHLLDTAFREGRGFTYHTACGGLAVRIGESGDDGVLSVTLELVAVESEAVQE